MIAAWSRFWFTPGSVHVLGIMRIILVLNAMIFQIIPAVKMLPSLAVRPPALMHPTGFHAVTGLAWPPDPGLAPWIGGATLIAGVFACLGLLTRFSLALFVGFYGYLLGGITALGVFDHMTLLVFHVLLVLIAAPGASAWSVDAVIASRRGGLALIPALRGPEGSRWGFQLILVLLSATYLVAGIAKLRWGGMQWLDGNTLAWYFSGQADRDRVPIFADPAATPAMAWRDGIGLIDHAYMSRSSRLARWLSVHQPLPMLIAIGAVTFELTAWAMLYRPLRNWILLSAVVFHTIIGQLMGHIFWDWRILCLLLVDWPALIRQIDRLLLWVWPQAKTPADIVVLFDGVCGLCDATVTTIMAADRHARLRFATLQGQAADRLLGSQAIRTVPDSIIVVQRGTISNRSTAILAICAELGGIWRLAGLLRIVPRPLRDLVYDFIARWRMALFGRRETCRMPSLAERARFID